MTLLFTLKRFLPHFKGTSEPMESSTDNVKTSYEYQLPNFDATLTVLTEIMECAETAVQRKDSFSKYDNAYILMISDKAKILKYLWKGAPKAGIIGSIRADIWTLCDIADGYYKRRYRFEDELHDFSAFCRSMFYWRAKSIVTLVEMEEKHYKNIAA